MKSSKVRLHYILLQRMNTLWLLESLFYVINLLLLLTESDCFHTSLASFLIEKTFTCLCYKTCYIVGPGLPPLVYLTRRNKIIPFIFKDRLNSFLSFEKIAFLVHDRQLKSEVLNTQSMIKFEFAPLKLSLKITRLSRKVTLYHPFQI